VQRLSKDFHVYAMQWDEDRVSVFVDDRRYFTYDRDKSGEIPWPFDQPMYLKLNLAVGGSWGGRHGIDDSVFPQRFVIDYVRVYQRP
jgi:beta-glucanase (GH16 family)